VITQIEKTSEKAELIFRLVQGLPMAGFERSFKMSAERTFWNRFLFGIDRQEIEKIRLLNICEQMSMPEAYRGILLEHLFDANQILFGFEESDSSCIYKVYLEFWDKIKREVQANPVKTDPLLMHLGLKWDISNPSKCAVTRYSTYPRLSYQGILQRLCGIYRNFQDMKSFEAVHNIMQLASDRATDNMFIYIEATEGNNQRKSFDVNCYKADLQLVDLEPFLSAMRDHYSIPRDNFDKHYRQASNKPFGHIAGGIDRQGQDFLTFYYEDSPTQLMGLKSTVQRVRKIGRNEPCPCGSGKKYKKCCGR
jgi:hypothetical protein